ncbi:hypothetical protein N2152v2_006000 [Parachlorella kessleri]
MHLKTVQIEWHGNPVKQGSDGYASVGYVGRLQGHDKTVNCVRFSPSGDWLVSSGDGGEMYLWRPSEGEAPRGNLEDESDLAPWRRAGVLRGHNDDIMDVSWSCDGTALVSGSIDNKNLVWDMTDKRRGQLLHQLKPHSHYTQGVAWDPAQRYIVTQSADRTCMVHALRPAAAGKKGKAQQQQLPAVETAKEFHMSKTFKKGSLGAPKSGDGESETYPLFLDECIPSFFRRLSWSPDGSFLVVPAAQHKASATSRTVNTAYVYARDKWNAPLLHLPGHFKPVVAVRFCPVIFKRDQQPQPQAAAAPAAAAAALGNDAALLSPAGDVQQPGGGMQQGAASSPAEPAALPFDLPYTMVFAVATLDSVVLYSTDSLLPLAVLGQLHYDSITDLAWSADGRMLAVSSRDCYCSIACFEDGELGTPLKPGELPPHIAARMVAAQRCAKPAAAVPQGPPATATTPAQQQPAAMPTTQRSAGTAGQPTGTTRAEQPEQQGPLPQAHVAEQAQGVKRRIQPEPVSAVCKNPQQQQQQQQQGGEVKRKRITPEAVGPAPAVVGESQGGTQVFAAAPSNEFQQPTAKKPKRIVPEPVLAASTAVGVAEAVTVAGAAAPDGSAASGAGAPPGFDSTAAAQAATAGAAATGTGSGVPAKAARRITPIPVPSSATEQQQGQQQASGAGRGPLPAESGSMVGTASKQAKRITPTPLKGAESVSEQFENAKQVSYALPTSESSRDGHAAANHNQGGVRRITPVPLSATSPLPQVADSKAAAAPAGAPSAAGAGAFNIAALALAAGKKAAMQGKGQ